MGNKLDKKTRRVRVKKEERNKSGKIGRNMNQIDTKGATGADPGIEE